MFDSYFEARLQAAPLLQEILGACKQTWYRKVGMGPSRVISPAPKAPHPQNSGFGNFDSDLEASVESPVKLMLEIGICWLADSSG